MQTIGATLNSFLWPLDDPLRAVIASAFLRPG